MIFRKKKKINPRRQQVRNNIATERFSRLAAVINSPFPNWRPHWYWALRFALKPSTRADCDR
jgi:hypothetical protein